jgi:hypothetical protein
MPARLKPTSRIKAVLKRGASLLRHNKSDKKEIKRFTDIYMTVYHHARKKGQTHKQALNYCWKVYADQAPAQARSIIKGTLSENMSVDRKQIRKMLLEMLEGEVISMADYQAPAEPVDPNPELGPLPEYESFLSDIHAQMLDFMEENFETLSSEQQVFLDEMMDVLEDELGIEEEASFDFGDEDEEVVSDIDDED